MDVNLGADGSTHQVALYLVFNVSGHVRFQFTDLAGPNAVLSGLFES